MESSEDDSGDHDSKSNDAAENARCMVGGKVAEARNIIMRLTTMMLGVRYGTIGSYFRVLIPRVGRTGFSPLHGFVPAPCTPGLHSTHKK